MKYEYTTVDFSTPACTGMDKTLNKLGKDGWELVSVCPKDISEYGLTLITAFFKRVVIEK
jgi:hypothetical protein